MKLDKETQDVLKHGQKLDDIVNSPGWETVKQHLEDKIKILESINQIPEDIKDLVNEIRIRKGAISIVREWIYEIEGGAKQHRQNRNVLTQDNIIKYE